MHSSSIIFFKFNNLLFFSFNSLIWFCNSSIIFSFLRFSSFNSSISSLTFFIFLNFTFLLFKIKFFIISFLLLIGIVWLNNRPSCLGEDKHLLKLKCSLIFVSLFIELQIFIFFKKNVFFLGLSFWSLYAKVFLLLLFLISSINSSFDIIIVWYFFLYKICFFCSSSAISFKIFDFNFSSFNWFFKNCISFFKSFKFGCSLLFIILFDILLFLLSKSISLFSFFSKNYDLQILGFCFL